MSVAPPDRLRAVLDLFEQSLHEPTLTSGDLAARAFLSPFHFTRITSASLGEAPGALRRRLLLERAAWQLATTPASVLTVALEAGYGSPEAFTRAFARSFGHPPRQHRAGTSSHQLHGASGIHFHPPGGLRLPTIERSCGMDVLLRMLDHHLWLSGHILDRASHLDDEVLDAPIHLSIEGIDHQPTLRSISTRLVAQLEMWVATLDGTRPQASSGDTDPTGLRARLDTTGPHFREHIASALSDGRAGDTFLDASCVPPQMFTYGGMLAHVLTFSAARRTMAVGALESAGITDLGSGDPMAFVGGHGDDASTITRS